ncbi:MAG: flavodoxin family protein [bacterium]|nr:flavodoxin family protein [bacterium]
MAKKILMISGSPRKNGDGAKILKELESILTKNDELECEYLFLKDFNIEECKGCLICQKKESHNCPIKDDMSKLLDKFENADGFIFISPVYVRMISAQMKVLFDRTSFLLHRPRYAGKLAILITNASFGGNKESLNYMKIPVRNMGLRIIESIGISSMAYKNKSEYRNKITSKLNDASLKYLEALFSTEKYKPTIKELIIFNKWKNKVILHKDYCYGDYKYWEDNKLLDKDYYYPAKINPVLKRLIPSMIKKAIAILSKRIGM